MEIYTVSGLLFQDQHFSCSDEAEIFAAINNGIVKVSEVDEDSPVEFTERSGEEITYKDYTFIINVNLIDFVIGDRVTGRTHEIESITLKGRDINSINFTNDFKREIEYHAEEYIEELNDE